MEDTLSMLDRFVFEEYLTVTPMLLTTLVSSINAATAKTMLARFAELHSDKVDILYLVTKCLSDGRTVISKTSHIPSTEGDSAFVCAPFVYQLRMRGSAEPAVALEKREADALLKQIAQTNATTDSPLWRHPLAMAVSPFCDRRPVRPAPSVAPASAKAHTPAAKPTVTNKPQTESVVEQPVQTKPKPTAIATAFAKVTNSNSGKRQAEQTEKKPAVSVVSVSSATVLGKDDEEDDEITMNQRKRKRQRVVEDEPVKPQPETRSAPSATPVSPSVETLQASVAEETREEPDEYKVKKKVTVTKMVMSDNGYMEVEDVQEMQEQIVKKSADTSAPKAPFRAPVQTKAPPSGQRSLMDMFKKK